MKKIITKEIVTKELLKNNQLKCYIGFNGMQGFWKKATVIAIVKNKFKAIVEKAGCKFVFADKCALEIEPEYEPYEESFVPKIFLLKEKATERLYPITGISEKEKAHLKIDGHWYTNKELFELFTKENGEVIGKEKEFTF